jgi:HK97 family phage prohead protease
VTNADLAAFRRTYGVLGDTERRTFSLAKATMTPSGRGDARWNIVGHASVFGSPSVEMRSALGNFTEYVMPGAFDKVLARQPDVLLLWDHDTSLPLARTTAGNLELTTNSHGLRYYATVTPTSYAADLRMLMQDGVVRQSSFQFTVAPGGEEWTTQGDQVIRRIKQVGELYDVTVTAAGAYPATDSGIARGLMLDYALTRGLLTGNPDATHRIAKAMAELELRRRRVRT